MLLDQALDFIATDPDQQVYGGTAGFIAGNLKGLHNIGLGGCAISASGEYA